MHNSIKNYAYATDHGAILATEIKRLAALTGGSLVPAKAGNGNKNRAYEAGFTRESAITREALKSIYFYVLSTPSGPEIVLMTNDGYAMIRRPEVQRLVSMSITQVLETIAKSSGLKMPSQYAKANLIPTAIYQETLDCADRLAGWLNLPKMIDDGKVVAEKDLAASFDTSVAYTLGSIDPGVLRVLGCIAAQISAVDGQEAWPWSNRSAWEEVKRISTAQRQINDLDSRLNGPSSLIV